MKLITLCSVASLVSLLAFACGLAFNFAVLPLFAVAAVVQVLLTWASDYRRPRDYAACTAAALRRCQSLPLAA